MKLRELMTKNVRCCAPETPLPEVARIMAEVNVGAVPVCSGKSVQGVVTDRDIVLRCVAQGQDPNGIKAADCMTQPAVVGSPDMDAHEAASLMGSKQIRRLVVMENGELAGIVALGDLATINIHVNEAGDALSQISEPAQPGAH